MRSQLSSLSDPYRMRRWAYGIAVAGSLVSMLASATEEGDTTASYVWPFIPIAALSGFLISRWRAEILAIGAGLLATVTVGESFLLWPAVAGLVFGSVVSDRRPFPWVGWAAGFIGSVAMLAANGSEGGVEPFFAVLIGGGVATLIRARIRNAELSDEASELRGQVAWQEQRTALARELHDVVGHQVTAMVVQAEAGKMGDPQAALRSIGELGRTALGELDGLVVHLRDPNAPLSVSAPPRLLDIDEVLAEPLRQQGVQVSVDLGPDLGLEEPGVLQAYRIAQEALTNVARHARARHAWVELARLGGSVRLRVSDDGVGLAGAGSRGSGLLGIQERTAALGGTWDLSERPGGGTMLSVVLPVPS